MNAEQIKKQLHGLNKLKKVQKNVDIPSFFIKDKRYPALTPIEIIKHNCLHISTLNGKISRICEREEHNEIPDFTAIKNEVIPDLIIYAIQYANALDIDIEESLSQRLISVLEKYNLTNKKND